jgi:DNA-binding NtrC family response regulator
LSVRGSAPASSSADHRLDRRPHGDLPSWPPRASRPGETLREAVQRIEALLIRRALDDHGGRRAATARSLGITREGLYK